MSLTLQEQGSWAGGWNEPGILTVVLISGGVPGSGLFVYSGVPAKGNLIASISAVAGTDVYGNTIREGVTAYKPDGLGGFLARMALSSNAGDLEFQSAATAAIGFLASAAAGGGGSAITIQTEGYSGDTFNDLTIQSPNAGGVLIWNGAGGIETRGPVVIDDPASPGTPETWHSLGTLANYTVNIGRYRLTSQGELELDVNVSSAGANAGTTTFSTTIAAAYRPTQLRFVPMATTRNVTAGDAWPRLLVSAAGAVSVVQTAAVTAQLSAINAIPTN